MYTHLRLATNGVSSTRKGRGVRGGVARVRGLVLPRASGPAAVGAELYMSPADSSIAALSVTPP